MDNQRSEDLFNEAISKWPEDPKPYLFKGDLYLKQAIEKGWQRDNLEEQPEWQPYRQQPEFLSIINKS